MKNIISIISVMGIALTAQAQDAAKVNHWYVGINGKVGKVQEKMSMRTLGLNYNNAIRNDVPVTSHYENKTSFGADIQIGYFFDRKGEWGVATGVMYRTHEGELSVDDMRVQYQATDHNNAVYRQVITAQGPIKESLKTTNIAIPLVAKFRKQLSKVVGIMIDAGVTYSVQTEVDYDSRATFDYEAIYKYAKNGDGGYVPVYDNAIVPDGSDWLITKAQYQRTKGDGNEAAYFKSLQAEGYNVGLNESASKSGTFSYKTGTIGILFQPSVTFRLSNHFNLVVGGYYMYQNFSNSEENLNKRITDKIGSYNSVLNTTIKNRQISYGGTLGLSFSF